MSDPNQVESPAGPVASVKPARVEGMDVARGLALLGILCVNAVTFAFPLGVLYGDADLPGARTGFADGLADWFVSVVCEGKFYPLFAMLFGMSTWLMIDALRVRGVARGNRDGVALWAWTMARRFGVLALIGAAHGVLLWYGDILLIYALCGFVLLGVLVFRPRRWTMLAIGLGGILLASAILLGLAGLTFAVGEFEPTRTAISTPATTSDGSTESVPSDAVPEASAPGSSARPRSLAVVRLYETGDQHHFNPAHPIWIELEIEAFRDGPFLNAMTFRAMSYAMSLFQVVFYGMGVGIVGLFLVGAALLRFGLFEPGGAKLRWSLMLVGWGVGLPLTLVVSWLVDRDGSPAHLLLWLSAMSIIGPMMAAALMSLAGEVVVRGLIPGVCNALASTGRMSLTNYLTQTLVGTFVMYHWGLAQFATWSRTEVLLGCFVLFLAQVVISTLWLRRFTQGPCEWLWRAATHLRFSSLRRG
jgi:uncharacterized protein